MMIGDQKWGQLDDHTYTITRINVRNAIKQNVWHKVGEQAWGRQLGLPVPFGSDIADMIWTWRNREDL